MHSFVRPSVCLLLAIVSSLAPPARADEPFDIAALRKALQAVDLRTLELPSNAEVGQFSVGQLFFSLPSPIGPSLDTVKATLTAAGWKPAPDDTPQATEEYAQARYLRDGFSLSVSLSRQDDQTQVMLHNAGRLDTARLARPEGATSVYESAASSIFTAPGSVAEVAERCRQQLSAAGWRQFAPVDTLVVEDPERALLEFCAGPAVLGVYVSVAPAQGGKTSVQYSARLSGHEQPWPADIARAEFDEHRGMLKTQSTQSLDQVLDFYRKQLPELGWSMDAAWIQVFDDHAEILYTRGVEQHQMLRLSKTDEGTRIVIEPITHDELRALVEHALAADSPPAEEMPAEPGEVAASEPQGPLARELPLPDDARQVEYDADEEEIRFRSPSAIRKLAQFFRDGYAEAGWEEGGISIVTPQVANFELQREGGLELSFTMIDPGLGDGTQVTISTRGVSYGEAAARPAPGDLADGDVSPSDSSPAADAEMPEEPLPDEPEPLRAEEKDGFPLPHNYTQYGNERTPFRRTVESSTPSSLAEVAAFYQVEMAQRGWKAQSGGGTESEDRVVTTYVGDSGTVTLTLAWDGEQTRITLATRDAAAAKKAGVLPKPGKARVIFGNDSPLPAKVTFGGSPLQIGANVGTKQPDGPGFDVPPGKYRLKVERRGEAALEEVIEVGADETWGVMLTEGVIFPIHTY